MKEEKVRKYREKKKKRLTVRNEGRGTRLAEERMRSEERQWKRRKSEVKERKSEERKKERQRKSEG